MPGSWKKDINAGGCSDNLKKYATNPQYHFEIESGNKNTSSEKINNR